MSVQILIGDCRERMKELPDASVDSVVCDPPYHLIPGKGGVIVRPGDKANRGQASAPFAAKAGFMGCAWDGGDVAFDPATWVEVLRVLKPGGHMVAFSGTRTYHRMVCAIEDAGFEIRDQLAWVYGSGFPKSLDVSKAIDKAAGAQRSKKRYDAAQVGNFKARQDTRPWIEEAKKRGYHEVDSDEPATQSAKQWQGWGTALKPSWEPICLARKPLIGSVAANVLAHGTGALNIDGCRVSVDADGADASQIRELNKGIRSGADGWGMNKGKATVETCVRPEGRWPANLCHDGSDEVLAGFPETTSNGGGTSSTGFWQRDDRRQPIGEGDSGSAARFFYCAKATTEERGEGNGHPTVKPVALMRWLCRLVTPKGGTILDPFMGSGSTGLAADAEQFNFIGCELSAEYAEIARKRIADQAGMFADIEMVHSVDARAA